MAVIFMVLLVGVYVFLYIRNSQIAEPEGCDDLRKGCRSCNDVSCLAHPVYRKEGESRL